jgi:hypothetical protein
MEESISITAPSIRNRDTRIIMLWVFLNSDHASLVFLSDLKTDVAPSTYRRKYEYANPVFPDNLLANLAQLQRLYRKILDATPGEQTQYPLPREGD